jgi:hypothetical protein
METEEHSSAPRMMWIMLYSDGENNRLFGLRILKISRQFSDIGINFDTATDICIAHEILTHRYSDQW